MGWEVPHLQRRGGRIILWAGVMALSIKKEIWHLTALTIQQLS